MAWLDWQHALVWLRLHRAAIATDAQSKVDPLNALLTLPPGDPRRAPVVLEAELANTAYWLAQVAVEWRPELAVEAKPDKKGQKRNAGRAKPRMTLDEANVKAREYLAKHAKKRRVTIRELHTKIGCSQGLASKLPAWRAYQEGLRKAKPPAPRAVRLTDGVLANEGRDDEALQALIGEQAADDAADRQPKQYRRRPKV